MKKPILEFRSKPAMCLCSSEKEIEPLVEASKEASRGPEFLLLLDYSDEAIARALPAFVNASIRFNEGIARASSMQTEMLLLVCGTMNIGKALRECAAKKNEEFLLFATRRELLEKFAKSNGIRILRKINLRLNPKIAGDVAITELLND